MEKARQILMMREVANVGKGKDGINRANGYKIRNDVKAETAEKKREVKEQRVFIPTQIIVATKTRTERSTIIKMIIAMGMQITSMTNKSSIISTQIKLLS
jgi:hypothetical protein